MVCEDLQHLEGLVLHLDKFFIVVFEPGEASAEKVGTKYQDKDVLQTLASLLTGGNKDRPFEITYYDQDGPGWVDLGKESEAKDVIPDVGKAKFRLQFTSSKKKFSAAVFFNADKGTLKGLKDDKFSLRIPQEQALLKVKRVLVPAAPGSRFMVILPTGFGKTAVQAILPFMMEANNVLVILPNLTINKQVLHKLSVLALVLSSSPAPQSSSSFYPRFSSHCRIPFRLFLASCPFVFLPCDKPDKQINLRFIRNSLFITAKSTESAKQQKSQLMSRSTRGQCLMCG